MQRPIPPVPRASVAVSHFPNGAHCISLILIRNLMHSQSTAEHLESALNYARSCTSPMGPLPAKKSWDAIAKRVTKKIQLVCKAVTSRGIEQAHGKLPTNKSLAVLWLFEDHTLGSCVCISVASFIINVILNFVELPLLGKQQVPPAVKKALKQLVSSKPKRSLSLCLVFRTSLYSITTEQT